LADLDENIICRSLPFGVDTSIGAVETHASENLILYDSEICDYSDRLLAAYPHQRPRIEIRQSRIAVHRHKEISLREQTTQYVNDAILSPQGETIGIGTPDADRCRTQR